MFSFLKKWIVCLCVLKKLKPYAIKRHTILALEELIRPKWRVRKLKGRLLHFFLRNEISSVLTKQQVLIKQQFQSNIHMTAFCYFGNFDILGERSILLNAFRVLSDGFLQDIPC